MDDLFKPQTKESTIIYDANSNIIAELEGHVYVRPKDYEDYLPVEYRHITTTTQITSIVKIDKKGGEG